MNIGDTITKPERSTHSDWFVYVLINPRDGEARYVGTTYCPSARYLAHLSRKDKWLVDILKNDHFPILKIIGKFKAESDAVSMEQEFYLKNKSTLTNKCLPSVCSLPKLRTEPSQYLVSYSDFKRRTDPPSAVCAS